MEDDFSGTRDLRDPTALGEFILGAKSSDQMAMLSDIADAAEVSDIPDYAGEGMIAVETAARYRSELEQRAAEGDRFAISTLAGEPE